MRWSFRLLTVAGIGIHVHVTFLLLVAFLVSAFVQEGGAAHAFQGTALVLSIFACVLLHELGHALTAQRFGVRTTSITLLPIGGVAQLERMPREPVQELLITIAGPLVNVAIAGVLGGVLWALQISPNLEVEAVSHVEVGLGAFVRQLYYVNVAMVIFNLIPAFPMDGGRILRSALAMGLGHERATRIAALVGQAFAFLFGAVGLGFFGGGFHPILLLIAVFVFLGASGEAATAQLQAVFRGLPAERAMLGELATLQARDKVADAVALLLKGSQVDFPVLEDGKLRGILTRQQLILALRTRGPEMLVGEATLQPVEPIDAGEPLYRAYEELARQQTGCLPLTRAGEIVGWVTSENIAELALVRDALSRRP
jgi:Zn-dependent protease